LGVQLRRRPGHLHIRGGRGHRRRGQRLRGRVLRGHGRFRPQPDELANLGGSYLGLADPDTHAIRIDDDAAGYGWFVDATPRDDSEFRRQGDKRVRGRMDLLSVIAHELGHLVGLDDDHNAGHAADVMADSLAVGTRRMPTAINVSQVIADEIWTGHLPDPQTRRTSRRR
jgi:hypothetical protein